MLFDVSSNAKPSTGVEIIMLSVSLDGGAC